MTSYINENEENFKKELQTLLAKYCATIQTTPAWYTRGKSDLVEFYGEGFGFECRFFDKEGIPK